VVLNTTPTLNTQLTSKLYVDTALNGKQDTLLAGENITITNNTISSTGGITQADLDTKQDLAVQYPLLYLVNQYPLYYLVIQYLLEHLVNQLRQSHIEYLVNQYPLLYLAVQLLLEYLVNQLRQYPL
jgi:hypothetical protein